MNIQEHPVTRLAILISSPGPKENYLPGSLKDPGLIARHLMSPRGGIFRTNEIYSFFDPKWEDVELLLKLCTVDYLLVYFSGHGFMEDGRNYFQFKNRDVEDAALFNDSPRQLIIGDACREYWPAISGITEKEEISGYLSDQLARKAFDDAILRSPPGKLTVHATGADEIAYESNGKGGVFTLALLKTASSFRTGMPYQSVMIQTLMAPTIRLLRKDRLKQNPEITWKEGDLQVPFLIDINQEKIAAGESRFPPITRVPKRPEPFPLGKVIAAGLVLFGIAGLFSDE
jgi:caspase domain-containing protein